ncbi:MAG TPA: ABC transporter permease [Opitutaceae bacterium]|nr:ABC transporter permease [Opitutaceae bacterium]
MPDQFRRLWSFIRRSRLDAEMAEEFEQHLELLAEEFRRAGLSEDEARAAARRSFGSVEQVKEHARDERSWRWLEQLLQDLRFGARTLRRNPVFTVVAVITLALGVGANTAIFSLLDALLLKPLQYDEPARLVQLWEPPAGVSQNVVSPGTYFDWREEATSLESLAAYRTIDLNLTGSGEPERLMGWRMTADGLTVLRARPTVGRVFAPDEDLPGKEKVVVLTDELFQRRFGGDRGLVGNRIQLNDEPYTVIGVLPSAFLPDPQAEFVIAEGLDPKWRNLRDAHFLNVLARIKSGISVESARAELLKIRRSNAWRYPAWKEKWTVAMIPMREQLADSVKPMLLVLSGAVLAVLTIACVNVANLLLAKAAGREREIALRAALGATRARVVRQLLVESVLLAVMGGMAGLVVAYGLLDLVRASTAFANVARLSDVSIDGRVLAATLGLSVLTGIVFGLVPALQATSGSQAEGLKEVGRVGRGGRGAGMRRVLIVAEVAMAMLLLAAAGLLLRSFYNLARISPGFDGERVLTMAVSLPGSRYASAESRARFYRQVVESIESIPGVDRAAVSAMLPMSGGVSNWYCHIVGRKDAPEQGYLADQDSCTAGYFETLGIPLKKGRLFSDAPTDAACVMINEAFARSYFAAEEPVGRYLTMRGEKLEIVGVVGDVRTRNLAIDARPTIYRSQSAVDSTRNGQIMIKADRSLSGLANAARKAIQGIDPVQPVANVRRLEDVLDASLAQRRITLILLAGFSGTALALAGIGLYGVMAYTVSQRTRELGIQMALGAQPREVIRSTIAGGMKLVVFGLALGFLGAFGVARLLASLLFNVSPHDGLALGGGAMALAIAGLLACWLPARAAARVDPLVALRAE